MILSNLIRVASTSISPAAQASLDEVYGGSIVGNDSIADRAAFGLEVMLIGMGVVFGVLLILIGVLQVFKLFSKTQSKSKNTNAPEKASAPASVPVAAPAPAVVNNGSDEATVVAIATAAIAAARGESECAFNVISIKKIVK